MMTCVEGIIFQLSKKINILKDIIKLRHLNFDKAKIAITHNMLTYDQAKRKGKEANFITHITATVENRVVYDASTSQFLSKNPLIKFKFKGEKGEMLRITYTQLKGEVFYGEKKIK